MSEGGSCDRGFSLLELIVVLAILAIAAAAIVPMAAPSRQGIAFDAAAREIAVGLRSARAAAIYANRDALFTIDGAAGTYWSDAAPARRPLPKDLSVSFGAGRETLGRVRFFPDGSASGGSIRLAAAGRAATIEIDPLTGRARLHVHR